MMAAHPGDIAGQIELQVARITVLGHGLCFMGLAKRGLSGPVVVTDREQHTLKATEYQCIAGSLPSGYRRPKVAMPIASKRKPCWKSVACSPGVCVRVLVFIYYTWALGTEGL